MARVPPRPWRLFHHINSGVYLILDAEECTICASTHKDALELLVRLENEDFDKNRHSTEALSSHPYVFSMMKGRGQTKWTGRRRK